MQNTASLLDSFVSMYNDFKSRAPAPFAPDGSVVVVHPELEAVLRDELNKSLLGPMSAFNSISDILMCDVRVDHRAPRDLIEIVPLLVFESKYPYLKG